MLEMLKKYKRFLMVDMLSISWVNCKITIRTKRMQCMHLFRLVVGKHGVDTEKWSLNPTAEPTCGADARVPGRVVRPIAHYMRCE